MEGTLDDLRKRLKDRWTIIEPYLPPRGAAKSNLNVTPGQSVVNSEAYLTTPLGKIKTKLASDLILTIPFLSCTDPELVLKFLIRANQIAELKLLPDSEFMALLMSRTSGRVTLFLSTHVGTSDDWGMVQAEIVSMFLLPRVKEKLLASYVLDRFQKQGEELAAYVTSVVEAAKILGFPGTEEHLVHRMLQNMHPGVRTHLIFEGKPKLVADLFSFATTVTEAVAVEEQRRRLAALGPRVDAPQTEAACSVVAATCPPRADSRARCWACGEVGHLQRGCRLKRRPPGNSASTGNAHGVRQ
jgi:hypothetical protein